MPYILEIILLACIVYHPCVMSHDILVDYDWEMCIINLISGEILR